MSQPEIIGLAARIPAQYCQQPSLKPCHFVAALCSYVIGITWIMSLYKCIYFTPQVYSAKFCNRQKTTISFHQNLIYCHRSTNVFKALSYEIYVSLTIPVSAMFASLSMFTLWITWLKKQTLAKPRSTSVVLYVGTWSKWSKWFLYW